jgi:hypothetical protein
MRSRLGVRGSRLARLVIGAAIVVTLGAALSPAGALAISTVDFEQFEQGTAITTQYADLGGAGQGVVFGPPPGGSDGLHPVIATPPVGQAQSGSHVADIATCPGCEFFRPRTTGSFAVPRSEVSVDVGYLGAPGECFPANTTETACAVVTLRAFDATGQEVAASTPALVTRGAGVHARLTVSTPTATIAGFEIAGRASFDLAKQLAIDDLSFGTLLPLTVAPSPAAPSPTAPSCTVATRQALIDALATCKTVVVSDSARIDLAQVGDNRADAPDSVIRVPDGVTLSGGRGPTELGGLLYMSRRLQNQQTMLELGAGTRVTGLRIRGYNQSNTKDDHDATDGIRIRADTENVLIDNNEIYAWPNAAVELSYAPTTKATAGRIRITNNFIHNNVRCGAGYGVAVSNSGFAQIDRNVFNFNRHDVASDGKPGTGYIAELNFVLTSGPTCGRGFYNQHFDMHGTGGSGSEHNGGDAGEYLEIRRNTIRGAQVYGGHLNFGTMVRPALELRGTPADQAVIAENVLAHGNEADAVRIKGANRGDLKRQHKLVVSGNHYGVDTAAELAVGDFDGDGRADVFQATGALWAYSPSGRREWRFLNDSSLRLGRLAFGDFNADGKTDVFSQHGDTWRVSDAGTGPWTALPAGSNIDMRGYRFGDFDGDGRSDVFRANGSRFFISSGAASSWKPLVASSLKIGELRFGDFDGNGKTDVFSLANGQWSVSWGGATTWRRLNSRRSSELGTLVFADLDGDRRTDVARGHDERWQVSWSGTTAWRALQTRAVPPLREALLGDFDGDRRADVLQHGTVIPGRFTPPNVFDPPRFRSFERFKLSPGGKDPLAVWSQQDMR